MEVRGGQGVLLAVVVLCAVFWLRPNTALCLQCGGGCGECLCKQSVDGGRGQWHDTGMWPLQPPFFWHSDAVVQSNMRGACLGLCGSDRAQEPAGHV